MFLDMSRNWLTWTNTEPVTYTSVRRTSSIDNDISSALRVELDTTDRGGGAYLAGQMTWVIPQALLVAGVVPKPSDIITAKLDGVAFTVIEARGQCQDANGYQEWELRTLALSIANDLRDAIDIERAQITYDGAGAEVKKWPSTDGAGTVLYSKLASRVQLTQEAVVEERGIQGFRGSHTVYLSRQVPDVTFEDRVRWVKPGSTLVYYLNILGVNNPERLDELPALDCTLAP